jgi:hypothetical protein
MWGTSNPTLGTCYPIDFAGSAIVAVRTPPEARHGSEMAIALKTLRKYRRDDLSPPLGFPYRLRFVRLHRDVVGDMLRSAGFFVVEPAPMSARSELISVEVQGVGAKPEPELEPVPERVSLRWQIAIALIDQLFPNDLREITFAEVKRQLWSHWEAQCKARNVKIIDCPPPERDMVKSIVKSVLEQRRRLIHRD